MTTLSKAAPLYEAAGDKLGAAKSYHNGAAVSDDAPEKKKNYLKAAPLFDEVGEALWAKQSYTYGSTYYYEDSQGDSPYEAEAYHLEKSWVSKKERKEMEKAMAAREELRNTKPMKPRKFTATLNTLTKIIDVELTQREGSRVGIDVDGARTVIHAPHGAKKSSGVHPNARRQIADLFDKEPGH